MTNEDNTSNVPISNWTLATGTKPGARYVYSPPTSEHCSACRARSQAVVGSRAARAGDVKGLVR